jgi:hypothetical protein
MFINERILQLRYKSQREYLTLLAVYAPEEGKTEQTEEFYKILQDQIDKINKNDYIIVAGGYNAIIGKIQSMEFWAQGVKLLLTIMDTNSKNLHQ